MYKLNQLEVLHFPLKQGNDGSTFVVLDHSAQLTARIIHNDSLNIMGKKWTDVHSW